ncbi:methyl-accepting chemotaxis protein [Clostridium sp. CT7]|nr:methyl-accepting chemotaxis protein [Clostridium sp. CT7]
MIPFIVFGVIMYRNVYDVLMNKLSRDSKQNLIEVNRGIDNYFKTMENNIDILSGNYDVQNVNSNPQFETYVLSALQDIKENNKDAINVYFANTSKKLYMYPEVKLPDGFDPTSRDWYKNAVQNTGKDVFSNVYTDAATKKNIISVSKAVYKDGNLVGVVCMDVDLTKLSESMSSIKIGQEGYVYVTDREGTMIIHPDKSQRGKKNVTKLSIWNNIKNNKTGFIQYKTGNQKRYAAFLLNDNLGWKIVGSMNENELSRDTSSILKMTLLLIFIIIILSVIAAILISKTFSKHINKIVDVTKLGADGDLSGKVEINTKDEFGRLAKYFNEMIENIHSLLSNVKNSSNNVMNSSKTILKMSGETNKAVEEVAETIDGIAQVAYSQAEDISNGVNEFNKLGDKITSIKSMTDKINELSQNANDLSKSGLNMMDVLIEKTKLSNDSSKEVSKAVNDMIESSNTIGTITDTINGIAEQTNLLALNAAVEAARAGEAGKGFSVVAEEVGKLAEESTEATKEVKRLIEDIKCKNSMVVNSIDTSLKFSNEQTVSVTQTKDIFNRILKALDNLVSDIRNIEVSINDTYHSKNFILEKLESISSSSEESAASSEEVSAAAEEVSASMNEFNKMSQDLEKVAAELEKEINKFIL